MSSQGNCFKINADGLLKATAAGNMGGLTLFLHAQHKQYSLVNHKTIIMIHETHIERSNL